MKKYLVLISFFAAMQSSKAIQENHEGNDVQQIRNNSHYGMGEQPESFKSIYLDPSLSQEELSTQIQEYIRLHTEWVNKRAAEVTQQPEAPKPIVAPLPIPLIENYDDDGDIPYIPHVVLNRRSIDDAVYFSQLPDFDLSYDKVEQSGSMDNNTDIQVIAVQENIPAPVNLERIYEEACGYVPLLIEAHNGKFPNNKITPLNIDESDNLNIVAKLLAEKMNISFADAHKTVDKICNPD